MSIDLDLNDHDVLAAMELRRRDLSDEQLQRFEDYVAEIFGAFGLIWTRRQRVRRRAALSAPCTIPPLGMMAIPSC